MLTYMFDDIIGTYMHAHIARDCHSQLSCPHSISICSIFIAPKDINWLHVLVQTCAVYHYIQCMYMPVSIKLSYGIIAPFACTQNNSKGFYFQ